MSRRRKEKVPLAKNQRLVWREMKIAGKVIKFRKTVTTPIASHAAMEALQRGAYVNTEPMPIFEADALLRSDEALRLWILLACIPRKQAATLGTKELHRIIGRPKSFAAFKSQLKILIDAGFLLRLPPDAADKDMHEFRTFAAYFLLKRPCIYDGSLFVILGGTRLPKGFVPL